MKYSFFPQAVFLDKYAQSWNAVFFEFENDIKHQFFKSLELYINDCDLGNGGKIGKELVLPLNDSKEAQRFMKQYEKYSKNLNSDYLKQVFFTREPYDLQ